MARVNLDELAAENRVLRDERDSYRDLYLKMLEENERLARGILGQKAERIHDDGQLTLAVIAMLMGAGESKVAHEVLEKVREHERKKPTGRKPLPENLPRVKIELIPDEVKRVGLENYSRIGEDRSEVIERRPASVVIVETVRPKFVRKGRESSEPTTVEICPPLPLPIERGMAGPGLIADTIVRRWQDHLPLNRQEGIFGREGVELARSTICGWHEVKANDCRPLVKAMHAESLRQSVLLSDACGVPMMAKKKCRNGHFRVVISPALHVTFHYAAHDDSQSTDAALKGFEGHLIVDAGTVYDHLFDDGKVIEVGCWAHARRYFFKAVPSDPERARHAIAAMGALFHLEKKWKGFSNNERVKQRAEKSAPLVKDFFEWCGNERARVLDDTPISKALGYCANQKDALERFLTDGRLPIHNNLSELQLRREKVGAKNWLFLGSPDGAEANAIFTSLLASCQMHQLDPWSYLRDLFCLIDDWPHARVLELAPAYWKATSERDEVKRTLDANPFRRITLGLDPIPTAPA